MESSAEFSCLLCGSVTSCNSPEDSEPSHSLKQWRTSWVISLCTILDLEYATFESTLASAQYCRRCQELVYHADFTVNTISKLHLQLGNIREDLKRLLRDHYKVVVHSGESDNDSDLSPIHDIIRSIGIKAEESEEELQTVQLCELVQNDPEENEFVLIDPPITSHSQRLQKLKRRHTNALKSKSRACKILSRSSRNKRKTIQNPEDPLRNENSDDVKVDLDDPLESEPSRYQSKVTATTRNSNFKCKMCNLKFQDSWKLRRHLRTTTHLEKVWNLNNSGGSVEEDQQSIKSENEDGDGNENGASDADGDELDPLSGKPKSEEIKEEKDSDDDYIPPSPCAKRIRTRSRRMTTDKKSDPSPSSPKRKKYQCSVCHAQFRDGWKLRRHTKSNVHSRTSSHHIPNRLPRNVPCSYCDKRFSTEEILTNHIRLHHREKYHNCVFCEAKHNDRQSYNEHLNQVHPEQKTHLCQVCGKTFFFFTDLRYHSRYHQDDEKKPVLCSICNMTLPSEILLKSHQLSRHPDGGISSMYTCPAHDCNLRFSTAAGVQAHVRYLHSKRNDFVCSFPGCGKRFGLQTKLDIHYVSHSAGTHMCPILGCGKKYRHKKDLKSHMIRVHPTDGVKPESDRFPCPVCDKTYFRRDILRRHIVLKNHYGDEECEILKKESGPPPEAVPLRDFECHICCMLLVDEVALKRHYFTHDNNESRPFPCPECQKRFSDEKKVMAHVKRSHRGGFGCEICGKRFARNNRLRLHMKAHSDVREYSCDTCGKEYKHQRDLMLHVSREHNGDKYKFACSVCDKKFTRSDLVRYHQVRKHGMSAPAELLLPDNPTEILEYPLNVVDHNQ